MSDTTTPLTPNQVILARYRLKKLLGRGGFGVVWLADDEELRMEVALKFLSDMIASNPEAVEDLKRETRFSLRLTHPHIVRIYGFFQDGLMAGLSMEHVQGGTLLHIRAARGQRCFGPTELSPWITQLCDALDYAHQKVQIVHRDLKPANLMLDQNGELKVADFGISRSISDSRTRLTNDRDTSGTLAYMSPQQMLGDSASPADDIYSLGATIYDLLSGKPPFHTGEMVHQVLHIAPPAIERRRQDLGVEAEPVPPEWEDAIAACLEKEPGNRPASAGEFAERLGLRSPTRSFTATRTGATAPGSDPSMETRPIDLGALTGGGDDAATVVVPETVVVSARGAQATRGPGTGGRTAGGGGTGGGAGSALAPGSTPGRTAGPAGAGRSRSRAGAPAATGSSRNTAFDEDAGGAPARSRLPVLIGAGVLLVLVIGGGLLLATRRGGTGDSGAGTAAKVPAAPSTASPSPAETETAKPPETSDDDPLLPPRESGTAATPPSGRAGGSERTEDAEAARLRRQVARETARGDWQAAIDDSRRLLALVPGDAEATRTIQTATEKLARAGEIEGRIGRLRGAVAQEFGTKNWTQMRADLDELERLVPGDREAADWRARMNAAQASAPPRNDEAARTTPETRQETPPPPKPEPARTESDEDLIRNTIASYKSALEALSVEQYTRLWVSLDADSKRRLSQSFADLKSQSVELETVGIDVSGTAAAARLRERRTMAPKVGNSRTFSSDVTMQLARQGNRWLITKLDYRK